MMKLMVSMFLVMFLMYVYENLMMIYNLSFLWGFHMLFFFSFKSNTFMWNSLGLWFGIDLYSFYLILLTYWIIGLMYMSLLSSEVKLNLYMFFFLMLIMVISFTVYNFMLFYLFFELSLIPTFIIIVMWGSNPERLSASMYLLMYTMIISLPLLVYIFKLFYSGTLSFNLLKMFINMNLSMWGYLMMFMAFYIKLPLFIFHVWLPKAHVEAPLYGSMILAAILLKLGGYGVIRLFIILVKMCLLYNYMIFGVALIGMLLISMVCLIQIDLKSLIAYSSVVHMNMVLCALLTLGKLGFLGAYIMMIVHGLGSSGLFYIVGVIYNRSGSRLLILNKGVLNYMDSFKKWWFYLCMSNFAFPFSLSFMGELFMLMMMIEWSKILIIVLMCVCFYSGAYSLFMFSYIYHGEASIVKSFSVGEVKEFVILINHSFPMILFMLNMMFFFISLVSY